MTAHQGVCSYGGISVRVVGYIRETPDPSEGEPAFAQGERIRRWTADNGHQLVAVCQDTRIPGHALGRDGLRALFGIIDRGEADTVLVATLEVFSPDKVTQEVAIHEVRRRGASVVSADPDELGLLQSMPSDRIRMVIRDVLAKSGRFQAVLESDDDTDAPDPTNIDDVATTDSLSEEAQAGGGSEQHVDTAADETRNSAPEADDVIAEGDAQDVIVELIPPEEHLEDPVIPGR